jgi:hypothetical protein
MRGGRGASRMAGGPVAWWRHTSGMHGEEKARLKAWGPRARAERTQNMPYMVVTLEVSKLSGWLKADARCRVEGRACDAGGERCELGGGRACGVCWWHDKRHMHGEKARRKAWGPRARAGTYLEHVTHVRDAGGFPFRNIRVEVLHATEEPAHVGDGRDVPVGNGAVCRNGGSRVGVERLERNLQGGLGRECGRAASRPPARFIIASGGEGRGGRPRATDRQLVGGGQGVYRLPRVERGARTMGSEVRAGRWEGLG